MCGDHALTSDNSGTMWYMAPLPFEEPLGDALVAWRQHCLGHSQQTINSRASTIHRLARSVDPLTADRDQLTAWLAALPVARASKATYRAHLRAFYSWLAQTGRREDDPSAELPKLRVPQGLPRPLSPADVQRVLAACADPRAAQTRAYVILAAYAGLRVHEVAKVAGEDVAGDELYVLGKGGALASVPMHPSVAELAARMPGAGHWFPSDAPSGHVHRCSVSSAIRRALDRAGVRGTPHALRHHYGTQVLRASGGNLRMTQRALRHANIATTSIYTQLADDELRAAIGGIPAA